MIDEDLIGKVKTSEERAASIPDFIKLTPEKLAESAENQKRWAALSNSPFLAAGKDAERSRAVRLEHDWRETISVVRQSLSRTTDVAEIEALNNAYVNAARQLSEALATQGRYLEAAHYSKGVGDETLAKEHLDLHQAIDREDDETCGAECDLAFEKDKTRITKEDPVAIIWSPRHNREVHVFRCNLCGGLNARPLNPQDRSMLDRRQKRRQASELVKGLSPTRAAETLRQSQLTTKDVFRQ